MRAILILVLLAVGAGYAVVAQLPEGSAQAESWLVAHKATRPQEIQSIAIDGRGIASAQLRSALTSRAGDLLDARKLAADRDALQDALAASGYLAAEVDPAVVTFDEDGGAFVTFAVRQGALFHLRNVTVTGPAARVAGVVTIAAGEVAETARIASARETVAEAIARRGKARTTASVDAKVHVDSAAAAVDVELATRDVLAR